MELRSAFAAIDGVAVELTVACICAYQRLVPASAKRACLLEPHCSAYAVAALRKYGVTEGVRRAVTRIRRCKPGVAVWLDEP